MKKNFLCLVSGLMFASAAFAQVHVNGYTRSNGTYVAPHYRSSPDSTTSNNYSTKGNTNPYTGKEGTRDSTDSNSYSTQHSGYSNSDKVDE